MPPDGESRTAFSPRAFRRGLRGAGYTATQYRVAVELCECAGQDKPVVWPSKKTLAEHCGVSTSTVKRALDQLESMGIIECVGGRKGGRAEGGRDGYATRWRLIVKGLSGDTLSAVKGLTSATLSDGQRVSSETQRVSNQAVKGVTGDTRSSYKKGEGGEAADAAHGPTLASLDGRPSGCCPNHDPPDGDEHCQACLRAWHKAARWDSGHPQLWDEYAAEMLHGLPQEWMAHGPPLLCDRGHPVGADCGTCGDLRQARKQWNEVHEMFEEDRRDRRKEIADCRECDGIGRAWVAEELDPWWCDHGCFSPPLSSFGTVSSVPPSVNGMAAASDCLVDDLSDSDDDSTEEWMAESTEHWMERMADLDGADTATPLRAGSEKV